MQRAGVNRLIGDFGGARVIVIGAGLLPPDAATDAVRDSVALAGLRKFRGAWFPLWKGSLTNYGQPDLLVAI